MLNISCEQICNYLDVDCQGSNVVFDSISTDTRSLEPGALFVAIKGLNVDGHDYIQQAIDKGAAGLLVSKEIDAKIPTIIVKDTTWAYGQIAALYRGRFKIPMVGITGSCGKTTVKTMVANILSKVAKTLSPPGSYNNEIGLPQTLLQLNSEYKYAVLEMGARNKGDIKYLMELVNPNVVLINNVAPVHLETFGSLEGVAAVKGEIYKYLQPHGTAVINVDEQYAPFWLSLLSTQNVITFGLERTADITCAYYIEEHHRIRMELVTDLGSTEVLLPVIGVHNVMNALAAAAVARALDISLKDIKSGLESFEAVSHRMQIKTGKNGAKVIDDSYNANPLAMKHAIDVLSKQEGKKIMVVGDMRELGPTAEQEHKTLGRRAKEAGVDTLLAYGDLSKFSAEGFGNKSQFYTDKTRLIADLTAMLDPETVVLIKGSRGMRMDEVVEAIVEASRE